MRDWLAIRANATPKATALSGTTAETTCTYEALDERVEMLAGRLAARGVGVDAALAVCLETSVDFLELVHATQRLGAVLVPLNTRLTALELRTRLERIDPAAVVCESTTEAAVVEATTELDVTVGSVSDDATVDRLDGVEPEPFDLPEWDAGDPLVVMFTSGTTGEPKGVVLTLTNVLASATASAFRLGLRPDDCWHIVLPMYHMGGLAPVYRSVLYGTAVSVQREFDPRETLLAMREVDTTCVSLVPTMLERLLDAGAFPNLRFVLLGGAPCPPELLARAHDRGVPVAPTYGMTETASQIATARPEESSANPGTVGNPLMFSTVSVRNEDGVPCAPGEHGEIVVDGPMVTPGYLDSGTTTDAFCNGGLRTGDIGHRDEDGRLWIHNRIDDRIITGGENVDPGEVAAAIGTHPAVSDVAVVGLPDETWGERVAALVVRGGAEPTADELVAYCRDRLADYKLPRTLEFADEIPRTASGTVDRDAVEASLAENGGERT